MSKRIKNAQKVPLLVFYSLLLMWNVIAITAVMTPTTYKKIKMKNPNHKNQRGMTLVELLVALVISSMIASAGYGIYLAQHEGWIIQEQVTNMQQNARVAMHELESRIRMAGYGLRGGIDPIYAKNTNPDTITVIFQNEINCEATIEHAMPQPSSELRCDGWDISCFKENTWAYIYDPSADTGEFFYITQVQTSSSHIQHNTMDLSRCYPVGSFVMFVDMYKFYIDKSDTNHPNLMRLGVGETPQVYAEDIEDLQFRYGLANGVFLDVPPAALVIREVLISLSARTERKDLQFTGKYRRRALTSDVKVRNLGL
ncbi:MAG: prepilin-type N-terminal cleavage/methylation domain-containing protein [candidate division Zixibacteria bacterium]|nr:prepilin-type N-terminal cleavage/methylation domain-containing protein [candidate division Zixibacteria bacterium]